MRVYLRPEERRPDPPPLRTDDRKAVLVGIAAWCVGLLLTLLRRDSLVADGHGWWPWVCLAGIALGLVGLGYLHLRTLRGDPPR